MKLFILLALFSLLSFPFFALTAADRQTIIIMLGAPGAGKGTQAVVLSEKFHIPQISTGELFRENLRNETPIGMKAKTYMDKGKLVPDEIVLDMLFERIKNEDCKKGYILDGFPRTIPQADALEKRLKSSSKLVAISLEVEDSEILKRLTGRIVCETCGTPFHITANPPKKEGICDRCGGKLVQRKDDMESVVKERLKVFHEQTEPVKHFYKERGKLLLVDGNLTKERAFAEIETNLNKFLK